MRGKLPRRWRRWRAERIIPAHAGQTTGSPATRSSRPDHPRACGANLLSNIKSNYVTGSSPRMRGKLSGCYGNNARQRIIPAHAGQTFGRPRACSRLSDHPRACGANFCCQAVSPLTFGSSPRMRGKRCCGSTDHGGFRIIPAHAGQTSAMSLSSRVTSDHPRACGANVTLPNLSASPSGSSPRMRGKHQRRFEVPYLGRIIPAHAGQTHVVRGQILGVSDHPRACGANLSTSKNSVPWVGSSPRMRGKLR